MEYRRQTRTLLLSLTFLFTLAAGPLRAAQDESTTANTTSLFQQTGSTLPTAAEHSHLLSYDHRAQAPHHREPGLHLDENPLVTDHSSWGRWLAMVINITIGLIVFFGLYITVTRWRSPLRSFRK